MALSFPLTFSLAPLPTGIALDANDFGQQLVANLQATISGNLLTGQIGGSQPTQNVGPWLNGNVWWFWNGTTYVAQTFSSGIAVPTGTFLPFGGLSAPTGTLLCNGGLALRTTYPNLFAVMGTNYGIGDGVSTFQLPDFRGRVPMGQGFASPLSNRLMGQVLGEETHVIVNTEVGAHIHTLGSQTPHQHTYIGVAVGGSGVASGSGNQFSTILTGATDANLTVTDSTAVAAGHNNIQPSLVCNWVVVI